MPMTDLTPLLTAPSGIRPEFAEALHETVLREKPGLVIEVGMANGASSLAICSGLAALGNGRLGSIDRFQSTDWGGEGVARLKEAGLAEWHELQEEPDWIGLPALLASGAAVDFGYIDG